MSGEFINPNWHVAIIHFPLGLIMAGLVVELICLIWTRHTARAAGRWMILLGTLAAIPVAMAGVYALRDVQLPGPVNPDLRWADVVRQSAWSAEKWEFMEDHLLNNVIAVGCFLVVMFAWLAASDLWRKRLYWPLLIVLLIGAGVFGAGAWHGGEAVYRFGVGVNLPGSTAAAPEAVTEGSAVGMKPPVQTVARYFLPPLQLHIILAGIVVSLAVAGLGVTLRRWHEPPIPIVDPASDLPATVTIAFPRWYWYAALAAAVIAAAAADWSFMGAFTVEALRENMEHLRAHFRLLLHVVFGVGIIVVLLILALTVRNARHHAGTFALLIALLFAFSAVQVWFGVLMLYDSHAGSIVGFGG